MLKKSSAPRYALFVHTLYAKCIAGTPFSIAEIAREIKISSNTPSIAQSMGLVTKIRKPEGIAFKWMRNTPPNDAIVSEFENACYLYIKQANDRARKKETPEPTTPAPVEPVVCLLDV